MLSMSFHVPWFAQAINLSPPKTTSCQSESVALVWLVQVRPSGLVITLLPVPVEDTATKVPFPHVTPCHSLSLALVLEVHVLPSGLVMTRLLVPVLLTATNKFSP